MKTQSFGTKDLVNEGSVVHPSDVGALIGKGASGAKKCISEAWKMYEKLQSSKMAVKENKPKLKIIFHPLKEEQENTEFPEQVWIEIKTESDPMLKLAQLSVKKHIKDFLSKKTLGSHEYIIDIPHRLLGKLIGKRATGLNRLLKDTIYNNGNIMIHQDDIKTAETARLQIKNLEFEEQTSQKIIDYANQRKNRYFLGWPIEPDDDYTEHISIIITFNYNANPFLDIQLYLERIRSVISDRIMDIKEQDEEQMDEINECLGNTN
tara:strand:- start:3866 stop:4657 length:792 start_codon:yes stop_codon:yes gene_type:complete